MAWSRLAANLPLELLDAMLTEIALSEVLEVAPSLLEGSVRGRVVVDVGR